MRFAALLPFVLVPALLTAQPTAAPPTIVPPLAALLPTAQINDNRTAAGTTRGGIHELRLKVEWASWTFNTATARDVPMLAFAEEGGAPSIPGPVLRVPLGMRVRASIRNPLPDLTIVVRGLGSHAATARDSIVVAPGATVTREFVADAEGTFHYWAAISGAVEHARRFGFDSQLNGAYVVDAPGSPPTDRVFVISLWSDSTQASGQFRFDREFWSINGRAWPETERLTYTLGDSIRWRVINASADVHPMHLHGFYFRVDARGTNGRDSVFAPAARRMAVTERLRPGETMAVSWVPDRDGGWIFHCHMTVHLLLPGALTGQAPRASAHDHTRHTEQSMAGLIIGIDVLPKSGVAGAVAEEPRKRLRLLVHSDSTPADSAGRRFAFVQQEGASEPSPDSMPTPGSTLVLRRDEPTAITVVNRMTEPTSVHWHGLELESYFDGVVGIGGFGAMRTPPVMPGDSFTVHLTPPRAGSFMYHTHLDDVRQQVGGLYAPFIVLEPGATWDPTHDVTLMVANHPVYGVALNGERAPTPLQWRVGETYRLRIANITVANPMLQMLLTQDSALVEWRLVAKDGFDLPPEQTTSRPARQFISNGEIYDVLVTPERAGTLAFEVRGGNFTTLFVSLPITVVP